MTLNMYIATFAFLLLVSGFIKRKDRQLHPPLMLAGILLDLSLVLYLQATRSALQTAVAFTLTTLQQYHVFVSLIATLLYFPVLVLGFKLWRGNVSIALRTWHIRLALSALICRTLGYFLMFSMIE